MKVWGSGLGLSWLQVGRVLEGIWLILPPSWGLWESFWLQLEGLGGFVGPSWLQVGGFGPILAPKLAVLGRSWLQDERSWAELGPKLKPKCSKNPSGSDMIVFFFDGHIE